MRRIILAMMTVLALGVPAAHAQSIDAVLDTLQYRGFLYFWNEANPANGLIRDRTQPWSPSSIAAVGFGLTSICIGIDHGWITRAEGAARVETTLNTFWTLPQGPNIGDGVTIGYKGFFYHFLDMNTGLRTWNSELSTIDTALLLAGIIDVREYFDGADATETSIRTLADQITQRVDWSFVQNASPVAIRTSWKPETGYGGGYWTGYNEMMIMYILAMGSPTHPLPAAGWNTYVSGYQWTTLYGQTYVPYGALFTHQYSHCWIDFRNKRDPFMNFVGSDYFTNSRSATLAQQAYCIANPGIKLVDPSNPPAGSYPEPAGYTATYWGLTAGDDPPPADLYAAHGAPGVGTWDNGTVQPTAVLGSLPFAPEICLPTIQNLYDNFPALWGTYGFKDGLNLASDPDWYGTDYLGIDQGPIVIMIENYRNASVWLRFMQNADVQAGMSAAGFVPTVDVGDEIPAGGALSLTFGPNPFEGRATLRYRLPAGGAVRLTVHDLAGREVARVVDEWQPAGQQSARFDAGGFPNGVYWFRLATPEGTVGRRGVLMR